MQNGIEHIHRTERYNDPIMYITPTLVVTCSQTNPHECSTYCLNANLTIEKGMFVLEAAKKAVNSYKLLNFIQLPQKIWYTI